MGLHRRAGASRLEGSLCVHDLSALRLWSGSTLPHSPGLQHPPTTAPPGRTPQEEMQAVGSNLAIASGMVPRGGIETMHEITVQSIQIITSSVDQGDGVFIGAETHSPHNSPSAMPPQLPPLPTTLKAHRQLRKQCSSAPPLPSPFCLEPSPLRW